MSKSNWRKGKTGTSMQIHYLKRKKSKSTNGKKKSDQNKSRKKVHTLDDIMEWVRNRKPKRRRSMNESQSRLMALEPTAIQRKKKQEKKRRQKMRTEK